LASAYANADGVRQVEDLDLLMTFVPWNDDGRAYTQAVRAGTIDWSRMPGLGITSSVGDAIFDVWMEKANGAVAEAAAALEAKSRIVARTTPGTTSAPVRKGPRPS